MTSAAHPAVDRVRSHAEHNGIAIEIVRFPEGTHTADDAARAIGCDVAQIVKSLVYLADEAVAIVLVSGADRADEMKLAAALGTPLRRATAKEVREKTSYVVGGVPPFGHPSTTRVLVDRALLRHAVVWAAAGLPDAVFAIEPDALVRVARASTADIRVE